MLLGHDALVVLAGSVAHDSCHHFLHRRQYLRMGEDFPGAGQDLLVGLGKGLTEMTALDRFG